MRPTFEFYIFVITAAMGNAILFNPYLLWSAEWMYMIGQLHPQKKSWRS